LDCASSEINYSLINNKIDMKTMMRSSISYVATLFLFLYSSSASLIPKKEGI